MAARLNPRNQDSVRDKIQVTQLVNVLQNHALGNAPKKLLPTRLKAIEILLKKTLPDQQAIEHTGEDGGPMVFEVRRFAPDLPPGK
jgi:hypothetical protein